MLESVATGGVDRVEFFNETQEPLSTKWRGVNGWKKKNQFGVNCPFTELATQTNTNEISTEQNRELHYKWMPSIGGMSFIWRSHSWREKRTFSLEQ